MTFKSKQAQDIYDQLTKHRDFTPVELETLIKYDNEINDLLQIILKEQVGVGESYKVFVEATKKEDK